jgi:uncharacterized protein involved in outer membrane biogenesis
MWRFFKFLLISLLVILLLGTGFAWWLIQDGDWIRSKTEQVVTEITGRQFTIAGELDLDVSLTPNVVANDLRLANASWAAEPAMATIERLAFSVDLMSLFSERLVVHYIEADGVTLALAKNEAGEVNWDLFAQKDEAAEPPPGPPGQLPFIIERFELGEFTLTHDAPDRVAPLDFWIDFLELKQDGDGPMDMAGAGRIGGLPLSLDGRIDPLRAVITGGRLEQKLHLVLGDITLDTSGSIEDVKALQGIELTLVFSGPDFAWITEQAAIAAFSSGPFDFGLVLDSNAEGTAIELNGNLGTMDVLANGRLDRLKDPEKGDLDFEINGPDLQALGEVFGESELVAAPYFFKGDVSVSGEGIEVHELIAEVGENRGRLSGVIGEWPALENTELDLHFQGPDFSQWGPVMRIGGLLTNPFEFAGHISNLESSVLLTSNELTVGDHRAEVSGSLGKPPDFMGAALTIDIETQDVGGIAVLHGYGDLPHKPLTVKGGVGRNRSGILLNAIQVEMEATRLLIDGVVSLEENLYGSQLQTQFSTPSLGDLGAIFGYEGLPDQPITVTGGVGLNSSGILLDAMQVEMEANRLLIDGVVSLAADFLGSELRTQFNAPSLGDLGKAIGYEGLPDQPLGFTGNYRLSDSGFDFDIGDGSIGEISLAIRGKTPGLIAINGLEAAFDISMPSLGAAALQVVEQELPDLPMSFKGNLRYLDQVIGLNGITGKLGDTSFDLDASVANYPQLDKSRIRFSVSGPDFHQLIDLEPLDSLPGEFDISGQLIKESEQYRINGLAVELGGMKASVDGTVNDLRAISALDMTLSAGGHDFSELEGILKRPLPKRDFSLGARLHGTLEALKIDKFSATVGPSDVSGTLGVSIREPKSLTARLRSNLLDLSWLIDEKADNEETVADTGDEEPRDRVFSEASIPMRDEFKFLLDLEFTADQLQINTAKLDDVRIGVHQTRDLIKIDPFEMKGLLGGSVTGDFQLDRSSELPHAILSLDIDGVGLGLAAAEDQDPATYPPWDITVRLAGEGTTQHEMASSLDGRVRVLTGAGKVANAGLGLLLSDLLFELFSMLNPFAEKSEYTTIDCGVMAFNAENGILTTIAPLIWQTGEITIISGGTIDLTSEKLNMGFKTKLRKGIGISASMVVNPFIKLGGTLSSPHIELDPTGTAVSGSIAVATVGLSLVARSLWDRFFSSRDPCGQAIKQIEKLEAQEQKDLNQEPAR